MEFVLWGHRSGCHGSEDWVRGLCKLLKGRIEIQSTDPGADFRYGMGELGGLFQFPFAANCRIDARPEDVRHLRRQGVKTVLWSTDSVSPSDLRQLQRYDAVVVTEQRTYRQLLRVGLGKKLYLGPEPAFLVEPVYRTLTIPPNTLALSLSYPREAAQVLFESYRGFLAWILKETDCTVALVPYCVTPHRNDLLLNRALARLFRDCGRVLICEDGPSPVLRGDLSRCCCCVGFEGAVAAWGCGVPSLCLQSTDRTLGLARDLFGSVDEAVYDYRLVQSPEMLIERFCSFWDRLEWHRRRLASILFSMRPKKENVQIKEFT